MDPPLLFPPSPGVLTSNCSKEHLLQLGLMSNVMCVGCHAMPFNTEEKKQLFQKLKKVTHLFSVGLVCERRFQIPSIQCRFPFNSDVKEEHHSMTQTGHYVRFSWGAELVMFFSLLQKSKENAVPAGYISHESCQHYSPDSSQISRWLL